jgi:hypothetical protein
MRANRSRLVRRSPTVPEGPNESSSVRSAGLAFRKAARPGSGRDDRQLLAVVKPHPSDQEATFRSSLAGRTSLFTPLPGTSYRATFNRSIRDRRSPWHLSKRVFEKMCTSKMHLRRRFCRADSYRYLTKSRQKNYNSISFAAVFGFRLFLQGGWR